MPDDSEDNAVGYKKPPKHTQWKKGQSGNPSGKKKKAESLHDIMRRLVGQEVIAQKNDVQMSMTKGEAMLTAIFGKAMRGDLACAKFLHGELGVDSTQGNSQPPAMQITEEDMACLRSHAHWVEIVEVAHGELAENESEDHDADDAE